MVRSRVQALGTSESDPKNRAREPDPKNGCYQGVLLTTPRSARHDDDPSRAFYADDARCRGHAFHADRPRCRRNVLLLLGILGVKRSLVGRETFVERGGWLVGVLCERPKRGGKYQ